MKRICTLELDLYLIYKKKIRALLKKLIINIPVVQPLSSGAVGETLERDALAENQDPITRTRSETAFRREFRRCVDLRGFVDFYASVGTRTPCTRNVAHCHK